MNPTLVVFKKELRDMFRDKRVRSSAVLMPMLLIIGLMYLLGSVMTSLGKPQNERVHVVRSEHPLLADLKKLPINIIEVPTVDAGKKLITSGEARVVLEFGDIPTSDEEQTVVRAYHDPKQQRAGITLRVLQKFFSERNKEKATSFLTSRNLPKEALDLVSFKEEVVQVGAKGGAGEFIVGMLPYLIVVWAFWGGMGIVSDLVAGEKEKNTLETLLITPVRRTQIVLGKFFALSLVCFMSSMSSVLGLWVFALAKLPGSAEMMKEGLGLTAESFGILLLVLIPTVFFFASLLLAISSFAKNTREAQTHLAAVSFVVLIPAIFVQFIGLTDMGRSLWINFVPVLNTGANIRAALLGQAEFVPVLATVVVGLVLAIAGLKVAVTLFNREQVLTRV